MQVFWNIALPRDTGLKKKMGLIYFEGAGRLYLWKAEQRAIPYLHGSDLRKRFAVRSARAMQGLQVFLCMKLCKGIGRKAA